MSHEVSEGRGKHVELMGCGAPSNSPKQEMRNLNKSHNVDFDHSTTVGRFHHLAVCLIGNTFDSDSHFMEGKERSNIQAGAPKRGTTESKV